jgi:hypothetical protein
MVNKTMNEHVLPTHVETIAFTITFDLRMSQGGFNAFALVFNCINTKREPFHVIIGIFEVHETSRVATTM